MLARDKHSQVKDKKTKAETAKIKKIIKKRAKMLARTSSKFAQMQPFDFG